MTESGSELSTTEIERRYESIIPYLKPHDITVAIHIRELIAKRELTDRHFLVRNDLSAAERVELSTRLVLLRRGEDAGDEMMQNGGNAPE